MSTPCFPSWRCQLAALGRHTTGTLRQATLSQLQEHLRDLIPAPLLSSEDEGAGSRQRIFSLRLTFECFVWQMLKAQTSCREVVRQVQGLLRLAGRAPIDEGDSAYIQARQRLPGHRLEKALVATAQSADQRAGAQGRLAGRPVRVVDGSSTQLPDTAKNQKRYPQPGSQKPGCGFPVIRFVALMSLCSGAVVRVVMDSLRSHDLRLFARLWEFLKSGDIVLGDRAFGEYTTLAQLPLRGVDVVARLHHQRKVDLRKGQRLGKNDRLMVWKKGCMQSRILTHQQWQQMPSQITVRIIRFCAAIRGFRHRRLTVVTTLLDPKTYPADQVIGLYARRWRLELCFRDLKTTLGMERLRCQSPVMAQKELLACLVAHNLVRALMAQAAARHEARLERISFKGALDALRQYSAALGQARSQKMRGQLWDDLLLNLARDLVPERPGRREPRAIKRRPKPFPLLNRPRGQFVEISHRPRYWKGRPRNYRGLN